MILNCSGSNLQKSRQIKINPDKLKKQATSNQQL